MDYLEDTDFRRAIAPPPSEIGTRWAINRNPSVYLGWLHATGYNNYLTEAYLDLLECLPSKYYVSFIMKMPKEHRLSLMNHQVDREKTFYADWPHENIPHLSGYELAKGGYYYMGRGDQVQCAFCHVIVENWEETDNPLIKHSDCPLAQERNTENVKQVPVDITDQELASFTVFGDAEEVLRDSTRVSLCQVTARQRISKFRDNQERRRTYQNWPNQAINYINLTEAGFFYINIDDWVQCFSCGIILYDWHVGDDPLTEHLKLSMKCPFLLTFLGQEFINLSLSRFSSMEVQPKLDYTRPIRLKELPRQQSSDSENEMFELGDILGFTQQEMNKAVRKNKNKPFAKFEKMIRAVVEIKMEQHRRVRTRRPAQSPQSQSPSRGQSPSGRRSPSRGQSPTPGTSADKKGEESDEELDYVPCFCCRKRNQMVVAYYLALPCGHLVYCSDCVDEVREKHENQQTSLCPYSPCRAPVLATKRVFCQ